MSFKDLVIVKAFNARLYKRLKLIRLGYGLLLILGCVLYGVRYSQSLIANIKILGIGAGIVCLLWLITSAIFSMRKRGRFYKLFARMSKEIIEEENRMYREAMQNPDSIPVVFNKDKITLIKGLSLFVEIPEKEIVWIYQEDSKNNMRHTLTIMTVDKTIIKCPGYILSQLVNNIYKNVYISIAGTIKHNEYKNLIEKDFNKAVDTLGKLKVKKADVSSENQQKATAKKQSKSIRDEIYSKVVSNQQELIKREHEKAMADEAAALSKQLQTHIQPLVTEPPQAPTVSQDRMATKPRKRVKKPSKLRTFFGIVMFALVIAAAIWSVINYPSSGKSLLMANTILAIVSAIMIVFMLIYFVRGFGRRSIINNAGLALVIVLAGIGFKMSNFMLSLSDMRSQLVQGYYAIKAVHYRNAIWVPEKSEYVFFVELADIPGEQPSVDPLSNIYTIKKKELDNSADIDELMTKMQYEQRSEWPLLLVSYYPKTKIISNIQVVAKTDVNKLADETEQQAN